MENINLKLEPIEGNELIIRQGSALEVKNPKDIIIGGQISAPSTWYRTQKQYDYDTSHVLVNESTRTIDLVIGSHEPFGRVTISGTLQSNPELTLFGINKQGKTYTTKSLAQLLKMNRIYFPDRDENLQLVSNLEKFKARVSQEMESGNDFKGNKRHLFEQSIEHDLKLNFKLKAPLFKGEKDAVFMVDVNFDITDGNVSLWLESVELKEIQDEWVKMIMDREVSLMKGLTVIHQ